MRYVLQRIPSLLATLLAVSMLTFLLTSLLPGDPALQILGAENATPEAIKAVRTELGLDDPLPIRYLHWLGDALTGDFGRSYRTNESVSTAIAERLPVTAEIGILAIVIALLIAIPVGMLSAYKAGQRTDKIISSTSFGLLAVPNFRPFSAASRDRKSNSVSFAVASGSLPKVRRTQAPVSSAMSASGSHPRREEA